MSTIYSNEHSAEAVCEERAGAADGEQRGVCFMRGGRTERIPAIPVQVVDPTGAGDSYQSGFLTAYVRGYTTLDCCRFGAETASFIVEQPVWPDQSSRMG